jgi:hypothetical protein
MPQGRRHAVDQLVRHGVLEALGLGMHAAPVVTQVLHEVELEDAVAADHAQRRPAALRRELHAAIRHVLDQSRFREALHHAAHRRRRHGEQRRDVARGGEAALAREVIDALQIVLDRPRERGRGVAQQCVHAGSPCRNGARTTAVVCQL